MFFIVDALMVAESCCDSHVNSLNYGLWPKECLLVIVMNRKDKEITYEGGCVGDEAGKLLELKVVAIELEPQRASMASTQAGQMPTPNICLFGFCWILKIRWLPILRLEFEVESQKWLHAACLFGY